MTLVMMVARVSKQLVMISKPPPRNPGSQAVVPGCQSDTPCETLVLSPHDDPFVGKL